MLICEHWTDQPTEAKGTTVSGRGQKILVQALTEKGHHPNMEGDDSKWMEISYFRLMRMEKRYESAGNIREEKECSNREARLFREDFDGGLPSASPYLRLFSSTIYSFLCRNRRLCLGPRTVEVW